MLLRLVKAHDYKYPSVRGTILRVVVPSSNIDKVTKTKRVTGNIEGISSLDDQVLSISFFIWLYGVIGKHRSFIRIKFRVQVPL